jgi:TRAP-type C4-dicarboxylate transport system substrate-binding protein
MKPEDLATLKTILRGAADKYTQHIIAKEKELVAWFKAQGVEVHEVDRAPFREATVKAHNGPAATWTKNIYDKLQGL